MCGETALQTERTSYNVEHPGRGAQEFPPELTPAIQI